MHVGDEYHYTIQQFGLLVKTDADITKAALPPQLF